MCNNRLYFSTFDPIEPISIRTTNGSIILSTGQGSIRFTPDGFPMVVINRVLFIPDLLQSLFSVSALPADVTFQVKGHGCKFIREKTVQPSTSLSAAATTVSASTPTKKSSSAASAELWHNRLGQLLEAPQSPLDKILGHRPGP